MKQGKLTIVIPAFNEEKRLDSSLEKMAEFTSGLFASVEMIVVDDGSSDRTASIARSFSESHKNSGPECRVISFSENRGKGAAVRQGMLEASGELALLTDADLSTPIEEIEKLLGVMETGEADIVIGSRALKSSRIRVHQPWYREYGGKVFNLLVRLITMLPFHDTQCGFKLFRLQSCRSIFAVQKTDRFAFDVEILYRAVKSGLRVVEEPVVWNHSAGSTVNMLPDSWHTFCDLVRIRLSRG